jgi:hypothetical protein
VLIKEHPNVHPLLEELIDVDEPGSSAVAAYVSTCIKLQFPSIPLCEEVKSTPEGLRNKVQ